MARGTPVIAINSGGPTESVKHEQSGYLIEKNEKSWAKRMELLQNDPSLRKTIGNYAKAYSHEEFSLKSMGKKLSTALLSLV
jgi:glycosyltransferase involved in cell wall biosynthesis